MLHVRAATSTGAGPPDESQTKATGSRCARPRAKHHRPSARRRAASGIRERLLERGRDAVRVLLRDAQRRLDADGAALEAALADEHAEVLHLLDDGDGELGVVLLGLLVLDQLDAEHEAHAA